MASNETKTSSAELFQPSPAQSLSGLERVVFVLALILVFGGFWLMGSAFGGNEFGIETFAGGLAADAVGFWLAFGGAFSREGK